jgi:hypothetical protein
VTSGWAIRNELAGRPVGGKGRRRGVAQGGNGPRAPPSSRAGNQRPPIRFSAAGGEGEPVLKKILYILAGYALYKWLNKPSEDKTAVPGGR